MPAPHQRGWCWRKRKGDPCPSAWAPALSHVMQGSAPQGTQLVPGRSGSLGCQCTGCLGGCAESQIEQLARFCVGLSISSAK